MTMSIPMIRFHRVNVSSLCCVCLLLSVTGLARAAEKISLADGKIQLEAPDGWVSKEPQFKGIVNYEFAVKAAGEDRQDGRVTIGGAGGGVSANLGPLERTVCHDRRSGRKEAQGEWADCPLSRYRGNVSTTSLPRTTSTERLSNVGSDHRDGQDR